MNRDQVRNLVAALLVSKGYQYGRDAQEQVCLGFELALEHVKVKEVVQNLEASPELAWERDDEATHSILCLVSGTEPITKEIIGDWTNEQCEAAENWAAREHLHASDNDDVERVECPPHVKEHMT